MRNSGDDTLDCITSMSENMRGYFVKTKMAKTVGGNSQEARHHLAKSHVSSVKIREIPGIKEYALFAFVLFRPRLAWHFSIVQSIK